jgi:hypothetical protein
MSIYAEQPRRRGRQLAADAAVLLWVLLWVVAGVRIHDLVDDLGKPGRAVEDAGHQLATLVDVGRTFVGGASLPSFITGPIDEAFDTVGDAGTTLTKAGADQRHLAGRLALWLGAVVAVVPIAGLLLPYLPRRVRAARDAGAVAALRGQPGSQQLLAMRALTHQPLSRLRQVSADPAASYARGDYAALAALELDSLGLTAEGPAPA